MNEPWEPYDDDPWLHHPPPKTDLEKRESYDKLSGQLTVLRGFMEHEGWQILKKVIADQVKVREADILNTPPAKNTTELLKVEQLRMERLGILLPISIIESKRDSLEREVQQALSELQDE